MSDDERRYISEITAGDRFADFFVLRKVELKDKDGRLYLMFELGDRTGRIRGSYWGENAKEMKESLEGVDVVKAQVVAIDNRGKILLRVERIRPAEQNEIPLEQLVPVGPYSPAKLMRAYRKKVESIDNPYLKALLARILSDGTVKERIQQTPAGKLWHHAYIGGLLEHSLAVAKLCETAAKIHKTADRDTLLAGALIHDIGKIWELSLRLYPEYTVVGRLLGHIYIGAEFVSRQIDHIKEFPEELRWQLLHLILSHHGDADMGSPVKPATIEASILHQSDMTDSQAAALERIIKRDMEPGRIFSRYDRILERFIYIEPYQGGE